MGHLEERVEPDTPGVRISNVVPSTAADKAGLRIMDVLLQVDGVEIRGQMQLLNLIRAHKPGDKVTLKLRSRVDGKTAEVPVVLGER